MRRKLPERPLFLCQRNAGSAQKHRDDAGVQYWERACELHRGLEHQATLNANKSLRVRPPPCGLRPDCNAVTVAVESPDEKRGEKTTTFQEQAPATESRIKELDSSTGTVSPTATAANNSATATAARQRDNQRALDAKRKERSRKRQGGRSISQVSVARPQKATVRFGKGGNETARA